MKSKNHHYIPKSVLKQFCFESETLLLFDGAAPEKGYRGRNVDTAFQNFHANTIFFEDGNKTDFVERWLDKNIDNPLGELLSRAKSDIRCLFDIAAKAVIARYCISLILRFPGLRSSFLSLSPSAASTLKFMTRLGDSFGLRSSNDLFGGGTPIDFEDALSKVMVTALEDNDLQVFMESAIVFAGPVRQEKFCIFDYPMMRYDDFRNAKDNLMQEFWFMLSPYLAVCFLHKSKLAIDQHYFSMPPSHARRLNFDFAMRSRYVASDCPVTLHRVVRSLGIFPNERLLEATDIIDFETDYPKRQ